MGLRARCFTALAMFAASMGACVTIRRVDVYRLYTPRAMRSLAFAALLATVRELVQILVEASVAVASRTFATSSNSPSRFAVP
ncbi:hypothetical protein C8F01DRAFT_1165366 [Mycena amicta]|nr:hypothetical protein C8F01DRAFT_1165366 [Mycena amicta]